MHHVMCPNEEVDDELEDSTHRRMRIDVTEHNGLGGLGACAAAGGRGLRARRACDREVQGGAPATRQSYRPGSQDRSGVWWCRFRSVFPKSCAVWGLRSCMPQPGLSHCASPAASLLYLLRHHHLPSLHRYIPDKLGPLSVATIPNES